MDETPKAKLRRIGVAAGHLAARLGISPDTMTRGLRGNPAYVGAVVDLLAELSPEQRVAWLEPRPCAAAEVGLQDLPRPT